MQTDSISNTATTPADGPPPPTAEELDGKVLLVDALRREHLGEKILSRNPPARGAAVFRTYLKMNGLSQSDMSRAIEMTRAAINRWWKGETRPSLPVAARMETISDGFVRVSDWYTAREIELKAKRGAWIRGKGSPKPAKAAKRAPAKKRKRAST